MRRYTRQQRLALLLSKASPIDRQSLFDRIGELHFQGIRFDQGEQLKTMRDLARQYGLKMPDLREPWEREEAHG